MKPVILSFLCLMISTHSFGQKKMFIHKSNHVSIGANIANTDSVTFSPDGNTLYLYINGVESVLSAANIDSISFGESTNTIFINYKGNEAYVVNPLAFEGVSVTVNGADVIVNASTETKDINYNLTGVTGNGHFKIYSEKRFNLILNGIDINNDDGPAINIQSKNKVSVQLMAGSTNRLADGSAYANAVLNSEGLEEDQKGAFFSEDKLVFEGEGSLVVNGNNIDKHAICSDNKIEINSGFITINNAGNDGLHGKDGITINNGTINVTATGDAIDGGEGAVNINGGKITTNSAQANVRAITCDSSLTVSGGTIKVTITGNQSKGFKTDQLIELTGGDININTSGNAVLEAAGSGYEPSYCTAIKSDSLIRINGANITITASGKAGRGLSSDGNIEIIDGQIDITASGNGATYTNATGSTDAYHAACIDADGDISIVNGTVSLKNSGSGGKGISGNGTLIVGTNISSPIVNVSTSGSNITISSGSSGGHGGPGSTTGEADESKAISFDGAIQINNGDISISSTDDGIKSGTSITINTGNVSITKSVEGIESPVITVNNGNINIVASDDGFNATKGSGSESSDGSFLNLFGGNIYVNASGGDGLDSNGNIVITGGTIVVHGPQSSPEVGMDYNGTCNVSGGLLVISGTNSNMTQATSASSSQYCIKATTTQSVSASTIFHVQDASGNNLVTFKPIRSYYSIIFTSPELKSGASYSIYTGGTDSGNNTNGLYLGGAFSGGTQKKSFTISGKVTSVSF